MVFFILNHVSTHFYYRKTVFIVVLKFNSSIKHSLFCYYLQITFTICVFFKNIAVNIMLFGVNI